MRGGCCWCWFPPLTADRSPTAPTHRSFKWRRVHSGCIQTILVSSVFAASADAWPSVLSPTAIDDNVARTCVAAAPLPGLGSLSFPPLAHHQLAIDGLAWDGAGLSVETDEGSMEKTRGRKRGICPAAPGSRFKGLAVIRNRRVPSLRPALIHSNLGPRCWHSVFEGP